MTQTIPKFPWRIFVGLVCCLFVAPGLLHAQVVGETERQICLETAVDTAPMSYYEPTWVDIDGPMLPPPMYKRPALGDPVFQAEIDSLCVQRKAKSRVVSLSDTMASSSRVDSGQGLAPKEIVLTFDDGPRLPHTSIVLDILARCQINAIFFMVGRQARRAEHKEVIQAVLDQGHVVGSHTMTHQHYLGKAAPEISYKEIVRGHKAVENALGKKVPLFRFPFGSGAYRPLNRKILRDMGLVSMQWNSSSGDTVQHSVDAILRHSLRRIGEHPSGVFLAHDRKPLMVKTLPRLLKTLMDRGYTFVLLDPDLPSLGPKITRK